MNRNVRVGMLLGLCGLGLGLWLWRNEGRQAATPGVAPVAEAHRPMAGPPVLVKRIETSDLGRQAAGVAEELKHRLSNTSQSESNLLRSDRALLLKNALIDTARPLDDLHIPGALRAPPGGGTYIVQARGAVGAEFQALLANANATVVSYIPNNAELVRVSAVGAQQLAAAGGLVQSVAPWAPYFKLTDPGLLQVAVEDNGRLPENVGLTLGVYNDALSNTLALLKPMKVAVVGRQAGPPGITVLQVHPAPGTFLDVAGLDGVMVVEAAHQRTSANDLTRVRLGAAVNSSTNVDYLGLSGSNVVLNLNDTGVDTSHPDLAGRIILDPTASGTDPNGHGTHTAGTILGNGSQSATVGLNAQGSATNALFSGLATNAQAYVIGLNMEIGQGAISGGPVVSDAYLQETAGRQTNVFISANPWAYGGSAEYDLAAASYDAAVRDAVPEVTGPQALLYVFAAGNGGGGASDGTGGLADTIRSPGTGKNVITVGAIEQQRNLTNAVVIGGVTNKNYFAPQTDSSNQVAGFSSRGNVGVGVEGLAGRFKPDVVAPGTFVLSTKPVGTNWNQAGYYNPSNFTYNTQFEQVVQDTNLAAYSLFVPPRAVQVVVTILTNQFSPVPFPTNLPIYVRQVDNPTTNTFDFVSSNNMISLPPDLALDPGATFFFSVGLGTNTGVVDFDLQTLVVTTNDNGNELTVQSNLNSALGPYYRYESGTSMAAAGVSGMLALIQEFLEQRLQVTNHSPALLKALLINGARTVSSQYDLEVGTAENDQGWGLPNLANSIPGALTNLTATSLPVQFFDMTGTNALSTGQSVTRNLRLAARSQPLRITLVWTDPAGNPAAGVKLVNDLDLLVTNLDTGEIFWGNDIPAGSDFSESWDTNSPPMNDLVNNVENVYLRPSLSTNYSVTVYARRVNVNAVTGNTNNVVQDYALVVSYGDGGTTTNAFTVSGSNAPAPAAFPLARLTNGIPLLAQRVGANSQYSGTTNGVTNQWNFYVFTNTLAMTNNAFTNVAIVALGTANPGLPRMGASAEVGPPNNQATRSAGPDLDLYVSFDPTLTNLNAGAIAGAFKSVTRTGVEKVLFTNSTAGQVYYIGVKSEDQQAAEYQFLAVATTNGFGQTDSNGNIVLTVLTPPLPAPIPPGSPARPGSVTLWALTTVQAQARKVVVEDTITHQNFGDLVGGFSHGQKVVVLNNHSFFVNPGDATETFVYDDTGENDPEFPNARHTDGPGSLENFIGDHAEEGLWLLSMVNDSSVFDVGSVDNLTALIVPKTDSSGFQATVAPESWHYDFIDVPANATNLTVTDVASAQEFLYLRRGAIPDQTHYDAFTYVPPLVGTNLSISIYDSPPLNAGRYYIGVFNPNAVPVTNNVSWTLQFAPAAVQPLKVVSAGNEPILDDAVTYSTNHVGANSAVDGVEVGVRINHPRESDLVLTLISPSGKRVLLAENRGGLDTNGYGSGVNTTNVAPQVNSGTALGNTNVLNVPSNSGTLLINYQFFNVPDDMRIYYDGNRIFDTGLISGAGTLSVDFGPGASTSVTIIMNEPGTNPGAGTNSDLWNYTVTEITQSTTYAVFTENTNLTTLPIKFAPPPFGAAPGFTPPVTNLLSGFDSIAPGDYSNTLGEGWTVANTNFPVKVVSVPQLADSPSNVLALHFGGIQQTLNTTAGVSYTLSFAYHGRPTNGPVSWWKGDGNATDTADSNPGMYLNQSGTPYAAGEVGQAFNFVRSNDCVEVPFATNLINTNYTVEAWIQPNSQVTDPTTGIQNLIFGQSFGNAQLLVRTGTTGVLPAWGFGVNPPITYSVLTANTQIPIGQLSHVAGTWDGTTLRLYINGRLDAQLNPGTSPTNTGCPFFIGGFDIPFSCDGQPPYVAQFFNGLVDELAYFSQPLSITNLQDIYAAGSAGKNVDPVGPAVRATVDIAGVTNATIAGVDAWATNIYTFTAPSNGTVLTIQGVDNGMLVDSFKLVQSPVPNPANYYLPEESLDKLVGDNAEGDWKLEVLDNRAGATNPAPDLVSWELSLVLDRVVPAAIPLAGFVPNTNTVLAGDIRYYYVDVPVWAMHATNLLFNTTGPVNLLFNQNQLPGTNATDVTLLNNVNPSNNVTLTVSNTVPLLQPGRRYYLGVQNLGAAPVNFTIEVDFDIIPLTNMIPYTNTIAATTLPQYYFYDVSSNAFAVAFEILHPTANTTLVARRGAPVPDELSHDYFSARPGTNNESIVVSTNSTPVALLTPGRWFLGVFNDDTNTATYAIRATEAGPPTIILLTNDVPYVMTNYPPGPALNLFFEFDVTNAPPGILFELYQLTGDVDLTLDRAALGATNLPYAAPFFASSTNTGTNGEQIVVRTNNVLTNLNSSWFLGVPNNASSNVNFTIHAVVTTNGLLISAIPLDPVVTLPAGGGGATTGPTLTWPTVAGETYEVQESSDLLTWTTIPPPIVASGTTTTFTDPTPIVGVPARYYRIVQIP